MDPVAGDLISAPHSNSFLDLDGDCMPDIFLQKQRIKFNTPRPSSYENYYEIYV
jgi:integrin alpha FG-GAP repeat containing protein 1